MSKAIIVILSLALGVMFGVIFMSFFPISLPVFSGQAPQPTSVKVQGTGSRQIIGFLPYWLLAKATNDYSPYLTTLAYFAVRINGDGSIVKKASPTEYEPGWYALESGKAAAVLEQAKAANILLSLTVDSGDIAAIDSFIATPSESASNLVTGVQPLFDRYGFRDLNLDIEYTRPASQAARENFVEFVRDVRNDLPANITITLEVSPVDTIEKQLIDIPKVSAYADTIVLMAYDYHATDSFVSGPVAPLSGAGIISEFDVATAVDKLLKDIPPQKLVLGIPLYGYEWEMLGTIPRSAIIPGSGVLASNNRVESFLASCKNCSIHTDTDAKESYVSFFSTDTNTNHLIFFPTRGSTAAKIAYAKAHNLGGLALWALGYEGKSILDPLARYKSTKH